MPGNNTPDCQRKPLRVEPLYMLDSGKLFKLMQQVHRILVGSDTVKSKTWFQMVSDTQ